jgi:L-ascorbate metabolism protein UlaG (beta-lactamase superfamily)
MELTCLGRSCFQVTSRNQVRILFDPFLDWYRERELPPLPPPDVICVSHGHLDHFADVPDLMRDDSPAQVVAIPQLCCALRELVSVTQPRLLSLAWGEQVELNELRFFAFRSPPMQTSLYDMLEEFGVKKTLDFLQACRRVADEILYLPLTSFGLEADGLRLLHFVSEGEKEAEKVNVKAIGAQFAPDVALVSVEPGREERSAEHAVALGAPVVIPHHYRAYGNLPPADLDAFARELAHLAPATKLQVMDVMETVRL